MSDTPDTTDTADTADTADTPDTAMLDTAGAADTTTADTTRADTTTAVTPDTATADTVNTLAGSGQAAAKPTISSATTIAKPATFLAGNSLASRAFYRVAWLIVIPIVRLYTRLTINGREHLPESGAFVLAPTHRSYLDTPFAGCVRWKRMRFMGKHTMWKNRQFGWVFSALGAFPVQRGAADREALRRAIEVLQMGDPLVLFPEGERKQGPVVQPLFDGAVYIAIKAGVPIVPVGIGGSERVMPKKSKFVYPRKVHIEIGPPIPPPETPEGGRVPRVVYTEYSERLHAELQRLFDLAMERIPWDYPIEP